MNSFMLEIIFYGLGGLITGLISGYLMFIYPQKKLNELKRRFGL